MSSRVKDFKYFGKLISEATAESDRAAAILLSAELDELLCKIIEKRLVPHNKKVNDRDILSSSGTLGSFAARIDMGYRLGVLDSLIAYDLNLVRGIRNVFAHKAHGLHFESGEPQKLVRKSKIAKFKPYGGFSLVSTNLTETRKSFMTLSFFLLGHLEDLKHKARRLKEKKVLSGLPGAP